MRAAWTLAALIALAAPAFADVKLSLDRKSAIVRETFYLIVRAEGSRIGEPVLPHTENLVIQRKPVTSGQQTSVSFINGKVQQNNIREWQYEAWATSPGTLEIPPVKVTVDGVDALSAPATIQIQDTPTGAPIAPGQAAPNQPAPPQEPQPGKRGRGQRTPKEELSIDDVVQIEASITKTKVYQGEALAFTVKFRRMDDPSIFVRGDQGNMITLPTVEGFYEAEISRDERNEEIDGINYVTTTFTRPMFATKPGTVTVPPVTWSGRVTAPTAIGPRSFRADRTTEPINIEVAPLPDSPPNFSGAVGRFTISGQMEGGAVEVGKPRKYSIIIAGEGNMDAISKPALPAMEWCHVSEPEVAVNPLKGPLEFEKRYAFTLTPMRGELQQVPQVDFCFFAPDLGAYKTVSTKQLDVFVQAATEADELVTAGGQASVQLGAVDLLNTDIAPIIETAGPLAPAGSHAPLNTLAFGTPPLAFVASLVYLRRQRRFATDLGYARGVRARSRSWNF